MANRLRFKELSDEGYTLENISILMHISRKKENKFKDVELSQIEINELLSVRSFRKTDKANT